MKPTPKAEITRMIHDLEDGVISAEEHKLLMGLLREDPEARAEYLRHMKFAAIMRTEADLEFAHGKNEPAQVRRRSTFYSVMAAAAILTLLAAVGYVIQTSHLAPPPKSIHLTGDLDSVWSMTSAAGGEPGTIGPGSEIHVRKGVVKLDFSSSAKAVFEGPSTVQIVSHSEIRMVRGRGWFRVTPAGHGFTVNTNHLKIVDLGTEFGVITSEDGREEVHVARGKVRVSSRRNRSRTVELAAGQAVSTWITEQLQKTAFQPGAFLKKLPQGTPYVHWSFDSHADGTYTADGTYPDTEKFTMKTKSFLAKQAPAPTDTRGQYGNALNLPGGGVYATSAFPGIGASLPRTIALWVRLPAPTVSPSGVSSYVPGLVGWGNPSVRHEHWRVGINDMFPTKYMVTLWGYEYSNTPIKIAPSPLYGQWHHLAYVFTGNYDKSGHPVIRHYLDGELQPGITHSALHMRINTDITSPRAQTLRLGPDARDDSRKNTFSGLIDELYIFRGALSHGQIVDLMHTNQYTGERQRQVPADETTGSPGK